MSNISRRKFLKGAGVAALAVAAAGVLAGCSDQSTPDTGKKRPITLKYMVTKGASIVKEVPYSVPALAETVSFKTIQDNVPADLKDYEFESTEDKKIPADGVVVIKMHKKAAAKPMKTVEIRYYEGTKPVGGTDLIYSLDVDEEATVVNLSKLGLEKTGYKLADDVESGIIKAEGKKFYADVYVEAKN